MKIIINADDLGLTEEINETIFYCLQNGYLSSTTILSNGKAAEHAIQYFKDNHTKYIGVHLALDGPFNISHSNTLVNKDTGYFFDTKTVIGKLNKFEFTYHDIIREYSMQIEKLLDNNLKISHIDHHHHLHLYPVCLMAVIEVAKKYRIKYIRPQRIIIPTNNSLLNVSYRYVHNSILRLAHHTVDGYFELITNRENTFDTSIRRLNKLLDKKYDVVEIMAHPRFINDFQTQFLSDKRITRLFNTHQLINYSEL